MNTNKFYLLIIIIILIIIISLFIQCNKKVLKNLEEKATKDIIETYFHLGSVGATESGQKGYKIISISEGRYGGRSSKEVLNNIGAHKKGDYISIEEKALYGSNLFNVTGDSLQPTNCVMGASKQIVNCIDEACYNDKLSYIYDNMEPAQYGGKSCSELGLLDHIDSNNIGYKYVLKDEDYCAGVVNNDDYNLTTIEFFNDYSGNYKINNIVESNWCGFFKSNEIFDIIGLRGIKNGSIIENEQFKKLTDNKENSSLLNAHQYKKYKKYGKYYELNVIDSNEFKRTYTSTNSQIPLEIPKTGIYEIMARGATPDMVDPMGAAEIKGKILLDKGEKINIRVGGKGIKSLSGSLEHQIFYGGGGGTYIVKDKNEPNKPPNKPPINPTKEDIIVIAGGSGWYRQKGYEKFVRAKLENHEAGNGGGGINNVYGGGGGGFNENGQDNTELTMTHSYYGLRQKFTYTVKGGSSYINGSEGGRGIWRLEDSSLIGDNHWRNGELSAAHGGYGGGGQVGGGGGYTGGNANSSAYSHGGTSYNNFDTGLGAVDYKHSIDGGFASIELIEIIE